MKKILLAIAITLSLAWPGWATIYVVANDGTAATKAAAIYTGSNDTAGECMSVATLNGLTGDQALEPGDTIYFSTRGGAAPYITSGVVVPQSGDSGGHIYFMNYPGETPQFHRDTTFSDHTNDGWTETGVGTGIYTATIGAEFCRLYEDGLPITRSSDNTCANGNYYQSGSTTVYYKPTSGTPADHLISYENDGTVYSISATDKSYIYITSNTTGKLHIGRSSGILITHTGNSISNNVVDGVYFEYSVYGIVAGGSSVDYTNTGECKNNEYYCCKCPNQFYTGNTVWNIHHNYSYGGGSIDGTNRWMPVGSPGGDMEFIGIQNPNGCNVYNNTSIDGYNIGVHIYARASGFAKNNNIYNNFIYNNQRWVIAIQGSSGNTFEIYGNKVYNNLCISKLVSPITYPAIYLREATVDPASNNYFYNNVVQGSRDGIELYGYNDGNEYWKWVFRNNILYDQFNTSVTFDYADLTNISFDNNSYERNVFYYGGSRNFTYWQGTLSQDLTNGSQGVSPKFIDETGDSPDDFKLQSDSPCIGAGTATGQPSATDYFDHTWKSPPSMGAAEFYGTVFQHQHGRR